MAFIQPCFIRNNTPELRKKLEEFGYKFSGADHIELDCIVTLPHHNTFSVFAAHHFNIYDDSFKTVWQEYIDCGTNEELFLALAALRNDSNENQWHIVQDTMWDENYNGEITVYYEKGEWLIWDYYFYMEDMPPHVRKATVEEIIEHFKST